MHEYVKLRVLVLEDSDVVRLAMQQLLTGKGFEVYSYPDPESCPLHRSEQCECSFNQVCADVLVTDLDMPHISGLEFAEELMQKGCKISHYALLTGNREQSTLAQAAELGIKVFAKPDGITALVAWLQEIKAAFQPERQLTSCHF